MAYSVPEPILTYWNFLPKPIPYWQLDPQEQTTVKTETKYNIYYSRTYIRRCLKNVHHTGYFLYLNTMRPRQNGRHFADDIFKCIFLNENVWISLTISLKFVPKVRINNIPSLVQIMAWRRPGDKPLSEPMIISLPTHICVTRPQWVNFTVIHAILMTLGFYIYYHTIKMK